MSGGRECVGRAGKGKCKCEWVGVLCVVLSAVMANEEGAYYTESNFIPSFGVNKRVS